MKTRTPPISASHPSSFVFAPRQRGVVLLVSLLFLIVLTLLGVAASRMVTSEERQSRYLREYNTAFQASEAAMRDARDDIDGILATGVKKVVPRIDGNKGFFPDCSYGLCQYDPSDDPTKLPWKDEAKWLKAVAYGTYSLRSPLPSSAVVGSDAGKGKNEDEVVVARYNDTTEKSAVTGVWQQPAYLVEAIPDNRPGTNSVEFGRKSPPVIYRLTARGYGADPNSRASTQEIYISPISAGGF
jgi:type IV pilus assembly protein PilX